MKLKWNFKTCQKETKVIAGTIWKVVGPGDKDVRTSRGSLRRFQKRDSFPKAQVGVSTPRPGQGGRVGLSSPDEIESSQGLVPAFSGVFRPKPRTGGLSACGVTLTPPCSPGPRLSIWLWGIRGILGILEGPAGL